MTAPNPLVRVLLAVTAFGRGTVELTDETLSVHLGIGWQSTVPRSSIVSARRDPKHRISIGAHGWAGTWLVNTSGHDLVRLDLHPDQRGRCLGIPARVRTLRVSLADPDGFLAALGAPARAA